MTLPIQLETKSTEELSKAIAVELNVQDNEEHFQMVIKDEDTTGNDGHNPEDNEPASA